MNYRESSNWNEKNEVKCLLIMKLLEQDNPVGMRAELCKDMARTTNLKSNSITAKVGNYLSVAGINKPSNASMNTKRIYTKYKDFSISELKKIIKNF
jgi:hypothetical protein